MKTTKEKKKKKIEKKKTMAKGGTYLYIVYEDKGTMVWWEWKKDKRTGTPD